MNIYNLSRHFDELIIFLDSCSLKFDVICPCEIWPVENKLDYHIDGYDNYNYYSKLNTSDEISVYINSLIQVNS